MTELLEAIAKVKSLPENERDNIATIILEKIEEEKLKNERQSKNLAESIHKRFARLEGVDDLPAVSRDAMREPPKFN